MLSINQIEIAIPSKFVSIMDLERKTQLKKDTLLIYKLIYGLNEIPVYDEGNLFSLLKIPLEKLLSTMNNISKIKYLIYVHTTGVLLPFGESVLNKLKKTYQLDSAIAFSMTMQKCVSYFKALELLSVLFSDSSNFLAIVMTGEVAFTPLLRVVPGSSIVGDAATASLFSNNAGSHQLLSVINRLMPGYAKGIYLADDEIRMFDSKFTQYMVNVISDALARCQISLNKIKLILPHNINLPTWKKIAISLNFPIDKVYLKNVAKYGHTFCSDHVINLHSALSENRLKKGDYYLMAGCGMGFYFSAAVFSY
ncbi:MAG: hypothetical protein NTZ67_02070 [Gammaproteobacteria bacterium]|nr:hypothetical protein [Gammaproteobacteria bacterium]